MKRQNAVARLAIGVGGLWVLYSACVSWFNPLLVRFSDDLLTSATIGLGIWMICLGAGLDPTGLPSKRLLVVLLVVSTLLFVVRLFWKEEIIAIEASAGLQVPRHTAIEENLD